MSGPDPKFPDLNNARENIDYLVCRPEPAVYQFGEELGLVAAVEVALPARGPEEPGAAHEALHPVVLLLRLEGHQVHTPLPVGINGYMAKLL